MVTQDISSKRETLLEKATERKTVSSSKNKLNNSRVYSVMLRYSFAYFSILILYTLKNRLAKDKMRM